MNMKHIKLFENHTLDTILDKINDHGMDSLTTIENEWLQKHSKDEKDTELENILSIDSGYIFEDILNTTDGDVEIKFVYEDTELGDDEYDDDEWNSHRGSTIIYNEYEYDTEIYTDKENKHFLNFELFHPNSDNATFSEEFTNELGKFFKNVGETLAKKFD